MKKILFLLNLCLLCISVIHGQAPITVTLTHLANDECQGVKVDIKNTGNQEILIIDGSRIDNDGMTSVRNSPSYLIFNLRIKDSSRAGTPQLSGEVYLGKPHESKNLIHLVPGELYTITYSLFDCGLPGIFSGSPVSWLTLQATFHVKYMVRNGDANLQTADISSNTLLPGNANPYDAGSRRDGGGTRPTDRFDSGSGSTRNSGTNTTTDSGSRSR